MCMDHTCMHILPISGSPLIHTGRMADFLKILFIFFFKKIIFWLCQSAHEILVPQPRKTSARSSLEERNLKHSSIREVPAYCLVWVSVLDMGCPGSSDSKESTCNAGHLGSVPVSGRSRGQVNGYPLQYSCLENSVGRGSWRATVCGVAESDVTERLTHW